MEFVRHEPPGRSTNNTAGRSPTAWRSRSPSASLSHPSLLIGTSAPSMPVMSVTAETSAWATPEWDTITPRSGSLIIFLEVFLQIPLLAHAPDQPVVERMRRIDTAVAQQVVHRDHFADHRQVLPGVQGHRHERQLDVEQVGLLEIEPGAVVLARGVPILELHDDLDALLLAHGANAEQRIDVDQPHPADLHVVARDLVATADEDVHAALRDAHDVVGDEAVPPLHQVEHALALADARPAAEQQPHAEDVGQRAVHRRGGSEGVVEERLQAA